LICCTALIPFAASPTLNAVVLGQIATDTAPGDRFVIDDEDARLQCDSAVEG